jgi:outer membrane protein TolC
MKKSEFKANSFVIGLVSLLLLFGSGSQAMTLKESIEGALKNNPVILASQKKLQAAEAKVGQATGAFMPTIKLDGNYGNSYTQPSVTQMSLPPGFGPGGVQNFTFGTSEVAGIKGYTLSLSQPLFVASLFPARGIAIGGAEIARNDLNKVILDTSFNVTQAYYGVLKAEKMVQLSEESMKMAKSHLDQVRAMVSAGVATRADLLRGEVQLANSEVALTKAKSALELARDAFNNSLGRDLEEKVKLEEEGFSGSPPTIPEYKELLKLAFDNRPDWKQYSLAQQVGEENLKLARSAYLPSFLLTGQTGKRITEYSAYNADANSWTVSGVASWTLFDGLTTQNRVKEAAANLESQRATEKQVRDGIALEVRDAYLTLKGAQETIGSARKAVDSAEENYKVSEVRYQSGVGTNLEVLDAQVARTQSKINHLQTLFDLEIAKAKINKVVAKEVF